MFWSVNDRNHWSFHLQVLREENMSSDISSFIIAWQPCANTPEGHEVLTRFGQLSLAFCSIDLPRFWNLSTSLRITGDIVIDFSCFDTDCQMVTDFLFFGLVAPLKWCQTRRLFRKKKYYENNGVIGALNGWQCCSISLREVQKNFEWIITNDQNWSLQKL